MIPEPGPLELYTQHFPDRDVRWDEARQLWAVWQRTAGGQWDRVELIFEWYHPPRGGREYTEEEVGELVMRGVPTVERRFKPFDYRFVNQRIREKHEYEEQGAQKYLARVRERNRARRHHRIRSVASEGAAYINEMKRYIPIIGGGKKIPLIGGANFLQGGGLDAFRRASR